MAKLAIAAVSIVLILLLVSASFYLSGAVSGKAPDSAALLAEKRKYEQEIAYLNASINAQMEINARIMESVKAMGSGTTSANVPVSPAHMTTTTIPTTTTTVFPIITRAS